MKSKKKLQLKFALLIVLSILFFINCAEPQTPAVIIFPSDGAEFIEGNAITLIGNSDGRWSCNNIEIGTGSHITAILNPGIYIIEYANSSETIDSISITVKSADILPGETIYISASPQGTTRKIGNGLFSAFLFNIDNNSINAELYIKDSKAKGIAANSAKRSGNENNSFFPNLMRSQIFPFNENLLDEHSKLTLVKSVESNLKKNKAPPLVGDIKIFKMADPSIGTMAPGFDVTAALTHITDSWEIWLDSETPVEPMIYLDFIQALSIALPRVKSLWGEQYDKNQDHRLSILISGKLNAGSLAIGFFNPSDFFTFNDDSTSTLYNPTSNEADIIYAGLPVAEIVDPAFSAQAIAATVGHEYQHLVRFGKKTYIPTISGDPNAAQEGRAFDEGMSHLTESLVGFGNSGGNTLFAYRYLLSPQSYSLINEDSDGSMDSVGKRGGASLFLNWLLNKAGGISWSVDDPLSLDPIKSKGLDFLLSTISNSDSGWEQVERYFTKTLGELFKEYVSDENLIKSGLKVKPEIVIDSLTGECLSLHSYIGSFQFGSTTYEMNGPKSSLFNNSNVLPSWSALYFEPIDRPYDTWLTFLTRDSGSGVLFVGITNNMNDSKSYNPCQ